MELAAGLAGADRVKDDDDAAGRLTYEIFSLLEAKFLFGAGDVPRRLPVLTPTAVPPTNKVCVLSIDGGACASDGLLAGAALVRLEASLRRRSGNPDARLPDFFDVAAGSGAGGVLAAMIFARGPLGGGRPLYTTDDALSFLLRRLRRRRSTSWPTVVRRGSSSAAAFAKAFGDLTLRDTVRPLLVPCYDTVTRAPFVFSRADAAVSAAHDFRLRDVCAATTTTGAAGVEVVSVDGGGGTRIRAVGGGVALGNPTAAAITHVLNNRREFPDVVSIDDLLVLSIGTGEGGGGGGGRRDNKAPEVATIAAEGVSDMVDQAVAMAFGHSRTSNYIRIQGTGSRRGGGGGGGRAPRACGGETREQAVWKAEAMLLQKSVESVLFQGRKLAGETNADKLERFARELAKEYARRKQQPPLPPGGGHGSLDDAAAAAATSPAVIPSSATAAKAKQIPTPTTPPKAATTATTTPPLPLPVNAAGSTEAAPPEVVAPPRRRRRAAYSATTKPAALRGDPANL